MLDIYNGKVWKTFSSYLDIFDTSWFFTKEMADSYLRIIVNLNWFQPFKSSAYNCGIIYGIIYNLPQNIRFKKENMLTLNLLSGSNELKLYWINIYLKPIIDVLLEM